MAFKKLRRIKIGRLLGGGLCYRLFIICCQTVFFWLLTGKFKLAIGTSLAWNAINMCLYYVYHYFFLRYFKMGAKGKGAVVWLTGLPCSGKTTLAFLVAPAFHNRPGGVDVLDGDDIRKTPLSAGLGFTVEDRRTHLRRVAFIADRMAKRHGVLVFCSFVSPERALREELKETIGAQRFIEIWVDAPLMTCMMRDCKGMYKEATDGNRPGFTGIGAPYEEPTNADVRVCTDNETVGESIDKITAALLSRGF